MKKDLVTAVIAAIAGTIISYLVVSGLFLSAPKPVSIKKLDQEINSSLDDPSAEVFNYRAINPTVEVYIDCTNYDAEGVCIDGNTTEGNE
ncbi:MAG: hypothetical protein Q4B87_02535 [Candidatus Saccharibacteria bacterium]|nr:hypothetical protein [Candidatus Saccharibacteria bacterium]